MFAGGLSRSSCTVFYAHTHTREKETRLMRWTTSVCFFSWTANNMSRQSAVCADLVRLERVVVSVGCRLPLSVYNKHTKCGLFTIAYERSGSSFNYYAKAKCESPSRAINHSYHTAILDVSQPRTLLVPASVAMVCSHFLFSRTYSSSTLTPRFLTRPFKKD